jgi:hypothetical protein
VAVHDHCCPHDFADCDCCSFVSASWRCITCDQRLLIVQSHIHRARSSCCSLCPFVSRTHTRAHNTIYSWEQHATAVMLRSQRVNPPKSTFSSLARRLSGATTSEPQQQSSALNLQLHTACRLEKGCPWTSFTFLFKKWHPHPQHQRQYHCSPSF